ncbi:MULTISPECIES: hypothetical protein [Acidobacterium]|nr:MULTISPECIES: hypothetical protein [Acidobacterium]HCT61838.1 hypothetical protein [Acidobacterium sp.]
MKTWQKLGLMVVPAIVIAAIGIWMIHRQRSAPAPAPAQPQEAPISAEEAVYPRKMYIDSVKAAKALDGKTVWVQAGYEVKYFPYRNHRVDYAHALGVLPSLQKLQVQDIVTARRPADVATMIPAGNQQVLAVFTMPGSSQGGSYATAIGYLKGRDSQFYCDTLFYYDDPHQMYHFWPAKVWKAIDEHRAEVGMDELQTAFALGFMRQTNSTDEGNRIVDYDVAGKKWVVTFVDNKATSVEAPK